MIHYIKNKKIFLFGLALLATVLPIGAIHFISFFLIIFLIIEISKIHLYTLSTFHKEFILKCKKYCYPIFVGLTIYAILLSISIVHSFFYNPYNLPLTKLLKDNWHFISKQILYPLGSISVIIVGYLKKWNVIKNTKFLLITSVIYLIYVILQKFLGIDWIHGFSATLPPTRKIQNLYRLSGLMGHPLSFSYNVMLLATWMYAMYNICFQAQNSVNFVQKHKIKHMWLGLFILWAFILVISGSRAPLIIFLMVVSIAEYKKIFFYWKELFLFIFIIIVVLYFEKTFIYRMLEFFDKNAKNTDIFSRLIFWKIHWKIFLDHPIFGVGYPARNESLLYYYTITGYNNIRYSFYSAHNIFLQFLADSGIVGFLGFVACLGSCIWSSLKVQCSNAKKMLMLFLCVTVLSGLFKNHFRDTEFVFAFWLLFSVMITHICWNEALITKHNINKE